MSCVARLGAVEGVPKGQTLPVISSAFCLSGEHLKPEFLKVNPLKKVPALRDGDFLLAER